MPLTSLDIINSIKSDAVHYREDAIKSLQRNKHMNEIKKPVKQEIIDAVLVDFINFVASKYCMDYGLYTKDLISKK